MMMLVSCSNCRTSLQLPPGATSIRCAICQAITNLGDPRHAPPPSHAGGHPPPPQPSPYNHAPPGPPPSAHGRKKAVIVGISYRFSRHELKGCINDAKCMKYLLINKFHFPEASIIMLTEEERDPYKTPTKHNIRMAMYWLVQGCQPGDSLVFHYSGHGSRQRNYNGDEVDGYDETLCPLDFETQGMIVDDEVNAAIVKPLPVGVKLHAIIDACHSGTVLDLPYLCRMNRSGQYVWEDHRPRSGIWKGSNGGEVISISGCDDDQTSADTSALSKITSTGAMTFCFIEAIEHGNASTYGSLLSSMRNAIRSARGGGGGSGVFLSRVNHKNLVRLLGFCEEETELALVYEFMENGSLHCHLHSLYSSYIMSWPARIKVALDAARGLEYLHIYADPPIIHRDIKSSNILLDAEWNGKVSDFGLSLLGPSDNNSHLSLRAAGTVGYMDPEYYKFEQLTAKSDVYSFGVVLLELLSGYRAIHKNEAGERRNVVDSVVPYIVHDDIHRILDPKVPPPTPFEIEAVRYVGYVAVDCVTFEGKSRPTMSEVVMCLERALSACLTIPSFSHSSDSLG